MSPDDRTTEVPERQAAPAQRGSALVLAIFVLVLLTGMGTVLLFLSENEMKMGTADLRGKQAYYLAEAGLEHARAQLWDTNRAEPFNDDVVGAAGADGVIDFDRTTIAATYDAAGKVTGFTGYNDDQPAAPATSLGNGMYIAFLTNDPLDGETTLPPVPSPPAARDDLVMLTGVGAGDDGSFEIVQAVIELRDVLPTVPPATITLLGPTPSFNGGKSKVKDYIGSDCGNTAPGTLFMPVVGAVGASNIAAAEAGMTANPDYESGDPLGTYSDADVFADLEDTSEPTVTNAISPLWSDCQYLDDMVTTLRLVADYTCSVSCTIPAGPPGQIIVVNGDIDFDSTEDGYGTLLVTGAFTADGSWSWSGLVLVIGEGSFGIHGAGNGVISGAMLLADIAGPDNVYDTPDDCTGGVNGLSVSVYDETGGGNSKAQFCTADLVPANPAEPYDIREFIQR